MGVKSCVGALSGGLWSLLATAVPTSFLLEPASNQRDVEWLRTENAYFSVYYDEKSGTLAQTALEGLNTAYPYLRHLLGVKVGNDPTPGLEASRFQKVPLILGTRENKGGFANPISQSLEVQTQMGSDQALFQHELVHRMMYEHTDLGIGPLGRLSSLAILPTWWIEGLPEYLTESVGQLDGAGVARTMALGGTWPTWDRLHSLYNVSSGDTFLKGYVTSGRLFAHLVDKSKTQNLAQLHQTLFRKIITPPFVGASDRVTQQLTGLSGRELYTSMQAAQKAYWQNRLKAMPPLMASSTPLVDTTDPFDITVAHGIAHSSSFAPAPFKSAFFSMALGEAKPTVHRRPVGWEGSGLLAMDGHTVYTTTPTHFPNKTRGRDLLRLTLAQPLVGGQGAIPPVASQRLFGLSTPQDPVLVTQVAPVPGPTPRAYAAGVVRGDWWVWFVQGDTALKVKSYPSPAHIQLLPRAQNGACTLVLVNGERGVSQVDEVCPSGATQPVVLPGRLHIRGGFEGPTGALTLLVGWQDVVGVVVWDKGAITPVASFPEWVSGLLPSHREGHFLTFVYTGQGPRPYTLVEVNGQKLAQTFGPWVAQNPHWELPPWQPQMPPFVALAQRFQGPQGTPLAQEPQPPTAPPTSTGKATYRHQHWLTYPYFVPDFYGLAHQVGLYSIPWVEEMERDMVMASALYNTSSGNTSGSITYTNNRIADQFQVGLFSQDRWNGLFYVTSRPIGDAYRALAKAPPGNPQPYAHVLRETGANVALSWRWGQTGNTWAFGVATGLSQLEPGVGNRTGNIQGLWSDGFGAQRLVLSQTDLTLGVPLWYAPWLRGPAQGPLGPPGRQPTDTYGLWVGRLSVGLGYGTNVGPAKTGRHTRLPKGVGFFQPSAAINQTLTWGCHQFVGRSQVATTQREGPRRGPLHSQETYSPLGISLLNNSGFTESLSMYLGEDTKSRPIMAKWSYANTVEYEVPVWDDADLFLGLPYLDSIVGQVSVTRGGVAQRGPWNRTHSVTTFRGGVKAILDVKGVPLYPSASLVKLWGSRRWLIHLAVSTATFL